MEDKQQKYAILVTFLASFFTPFMGSSINVALPSIAAEFHIDALILGWIPTAYLLSLAVFLVPLGRIADLHGRKMIFTTGIIIFTLTSFLSAFSPSAEVLIFFRILQGIGSAMIFGNAAAIIATSFHPGERGRALGITLTGVFLGLFLGPVLGGVLTQFLGWRSLFFFNVPLGLISFLSVTQLKGEWVEASGEKFDVKGSALLGLSLISALYGLTILSTITGLILLLLGLAGLILFYYVEKRVEHPVLDVSLFKNPVFTLNNMAALINYCAGVPIVFLLSLYLQYIQGLNSADTGLLLAVQPIFMTIFSPLGGRLSDKIESRLVAASGMIITSLGLGILVFISQETGFLLIISSLMLIGLGFALFSSSNTNIILNSVESRYYGVASATLTTMRVLGQMTGMGITLVALNILVGPGVIETYEYPQFILSAHLSFAIFALLSFLGALASLTSNKKIITMTKNKLS